MKHILFINNYDMAKSRKSYLNGCSPSHHQFGTSELIDMGEYTVDYMLAAPKKYNNRILKLLSLLPVWFNIYRKARKYDIVYGGADFTVDFLGFMKNLGLFRPKLAAIFHHPPFSFRLKYEKYDHIIFLSSFAYKEMAQLFPAKAAHMAFIQWGPDQAFYQMLAPVPNCTKTQKEIIFISNGKTKRDHDLLVDATENIKARTIIVSDEYSLPFNYSKDKCKYTEIFYQNKPDDTKMVKLLNKCSVLIVPTPPTQQKLGPIGLTSFLDAVALGMPIITADNTVFTDIVTSHKMGLVYKAGDKNDLERAMTFFIENPECITEYGKNAYEFGLKNDMKIFVTQLYQLFEQ